MHKILSYCDNRPTNKQAHKQTQPITIHYAAKLSVQCNQGKVLADDSVTAQSSFSFDRKYAKRGAT